MHRFFNRNDIILTASVLIASFVLMFLMNISRNIGERVEVFVDGKAVGEYLLSEERSVEINGYKGSHNTLIISDGSAYIEDASCPDKLCIHQGRIKKSGQTIVCLPNRVVIKIEGESGGGYDAITR